MKENPDIMKFNIVTPSYNQLDYLKRAVASVRDQVCDGVAVQHHVQDGGSDDGTVDWLHQYGAEVRGQRTEVRPCFNDFQRLTFLTSREAVPPARREGAKPRFNEGAKPRL